MTDAWAARKSSPLSTAPWTSPMAGLRALVLEKPRIVPAVE